MVRSVAMPVHLGWQLRDPGPAPRSRLLDCVPSAADPARFAAAHRQWRQDVEADEALLLRQHARSTVWYPVVSQGFGAVVPFYGGSATTRIAAVVTAVGSLVQAGATRIAVLDLENTGLVDRLQSSARLRWGGVVRAMSCRGSDLDVFKSVVVEDLASLIVDVLPNDGDTTAVREAARVKRRLLDVAGQIDEPKSLPRLQQAVQFALTGQPPAGHAFAPGEEDRLLDYHNTHVRQRRDLADTLDTLDADLGTLAQYAHRPGRPARAFGNGNQVAVYDVDDTAGIHEHRIGRELLARYVAREKQRRRAASGAPPPPLIVLGAGRVAPDVLDGLAHAAERDGFPLLLFLDRLAEGPGKALLGSGGRARAVFFTLAHPEDAQLAAEFLGRQYTFVVNGHTITDGTSEEWSTTDTVGSDQTTSRCWNFGQGFGSSLTRGMSQSRSSAAGRGGGRNHSVAQSSQRVHEFVLEPEEFKRLPDTAALVIDGDEVTLTFCDPAIRGNRLAIAYP